MCAFRWNASHFAWSPLCAASRSADAAGALRARRRRSRGPRRRLSGTRSDSVRGSSPSPPGVSPRAPVEEGDLHDEVREGGSVRSVEVARERGLPLGQARHLLLQRGDDLFGTLRRDRGVHVDALALECARAGNARPCSRSPRGRSARAGLGDPPTRVLEENANPDRSPRTGRTAPRPRCRFVLTSEERARERTASRAPTRRHRASRSSRACLPPALAEGPPETTADHAFDATPRSRHDRSRRTACLASRVVSSSRPRFLGRRNATKVGDAFRRTASSAEFGLAGQ